MADSGSIERTVFISYRRETSSFLARSIFQDLRQHGYDVFMDVENIDCGTFDTIILHQIAARAHFIIILEPGSEKRLADQEDWLRREIERTIELKRNIVPILAKNFSFKEAKPYLTGKLNQLPRYSGVPMHHEYFEAAMERLRNRFLHKPVHVSVATTPPGEQQEVQRKVERAVTLHEPTNEQIAREEALTEKDVEEKRQRAEAEARRKAAEERQRQAEEEARRKAEEERKSKPFAIKIAPT